jgi:hypothetical protein
MPIEMNCDSRRVTALNVTHGAQSATLNGRLIVNVLDLDGCPDCIRNIPSAVGEFFTYLYPDIHMFWRSLISMGGGTSSRDIDRRINEITQFVTVIENCGNHRNAVRERFQRLSPQVRSLFFYINENHINEFVTDPAKTQEIGRELTRECRRIIGFQRQLRAVNIFYRIFCGTSNSTIGGTTRPRQRREPEPLEGEPEPFVEYRGGWGEWLEGLFGNDIRPRRSDGITSGRRAETSQQIHLDIPGTVRYDRNAIPQDVRQKAAEIIRLKGQFETLRNPPSVPPIYADVIMADSFMALPIFDASHPEIQRIVRAALLPDTASEIAGLGNRDLHHIFDCEALETHMDTSTSWAPAKCPLCRHPENGGINRNYLRIDIALQNEILQFLRRAVGN